MNYACQADLQRSVRLAERLEENMEMYFSICHFEGLNHSRQVILLSSGENTGLSLKKGKRCRRLGALAAGQTGNSRINHRGGWQAAMGELDGWRQPQWEQGWSGGG